jgi:hypothetical protein
MTCSNKTSCKPRLSVCALGLAFGVSWALGVLVLGLLAWKFHNYGSAFINALSSVYIGYNPSPKGIAIGTGWALLDGFVWGAIIALVYNLCKKCCCSGCKSCCKVMPFSIDVKSLNKPDEERVLPKTKIEAVKVGTTTIMRVTFEPGWKWSECIKPSAGTQSCQAPHVGYIISGKMKIVMDNGTEKEVGPGDAMSVSPGHDAWIIGNEACVVIDFTAGEMYGKKR